MFKHGFASSGFGVLNDRVIALANPSSGASTSAGPLQLSGLEQPRSGARLTPNWRAALVGVFSVFCMATVSAQTSTLEFDSANSGGASGNGPSTSAQTVLFRNNQNNPGDSTFNTTVTPVTATVTLSNFQNVGTAGAPVNATVGFGQGFTSGSPASLPIYGSVSAFGGPANNMFTSVTTAGTGLDTAANGALALGTGTAGISVAAHATNTRVPMVDMTITFSQAVTNPVIHFGGMGGFSGNLGLTTEFDLITGGVTLSKLSGLANFVVDTTTVPGTTQINNTSTALGVSCATSPAGAACGSVRVNGTNITSVAFRIYLRGNGGDTTTWNPSGANTPPDTSGDVWTVSVSLQSSPNLIVTKTANATTAPQGGAFSYTLTAQNTGTATSASPTTISDVIPAGLTVNTITGVPAGWACTPSSALPLVGNGTTTTVTCTAAAGLAPAAAATSIATLNVTKTNRLSINNTANVTAGDPACVAPLPARCTSTVTVSDNSPVVNVTKAAPTITGTGNPYSASYLITVTNTGGGVGSYTLSDTPGFAPGVTINSATVATTGGTVVTPTLTTLTNNTASQISAANVAIAAGASHTYTVTISFNTSAGASNLTCNATPNNGLYNAASITGSTPGSSSNCGPGPGLPNVTVAKAAPAVTGTTNPYAASYVITVANTGSAAGSYTLSDTPGFAPGVTINSATVATTGGTVVTPTLTTLTNNTASQISAANVAIAAGASHTYTVTISFNTSAGASNLTCNATPNNGLYNAASITGSTPGSSSNCGPGPGLPNVTVAKAAPAVTGTTNPYAASYVITVANTGSAAGSYTLSDTPGFAPGVTINSATVATTGGTVVTPTLTTLTNNTASQISAANVAIAAGASHTYTVTISFNTSAGASNLTCNATPNNGLYNAASITGSTPGSSSNCGPGPGLPNVTVAKAAPAVTGTTNPYAASYVITVANTGSAAGSYTLSDTPGFAPGVTINSATVATTGGTVVTPTLTTLTNNTASQISAANVAIAAGASHTYTVTISFNTSAGASNLTCNATPNNGLYNAASITGSTPGSSSNCGPGPGLPNVTVAKAAPAVTGTTNPYAASYVITVANTGSAAGSYTLSDTPGFAPGVTINSATVATTGGTVVTPTLTTLTNNTASQISAANVAIAAGASHTYTVTISFNTSAGASNLTCNATPNNGLYNAASITGSTPGSSSNCGPGPGLPNVTVAKAAPAVTGTTNPYAASYVITVANTGSAAGSYTLSDTPGFAPGVTINSATVATTGGTVVTPTLTTLTNNTASQISAANVAIAAGASHTYTVTISFNTSAGASNLTCNATPNNGLYNAASITGSTPGSSSNCGPGPGLPNVTVAKAAPAVTGTTNPYAASYVITVANTGSAAGSYTLSDTPGFAPGVTINSATVATTGGTVVTPTLTTLTNNTASQISAANVAIAAGASHTYTVTISFNTSAGASNLTCNATPNNGLYNAASITGSTPGSSSNCGPGPGLPNVTVAKAAPAVTGTTNPYAASYVITVANTGSAAGSYTLSDTPGFAPGVTINSATVATTGGTVVTPTLTTLTNNTASQISAANVAIAAGASHTYTVTISFNTSAGASNLTCNATPNNGLYNAASITGSTPGSSSNCGPGPGLPNVTVAKAAPAVTGTTNPYAASYVITVANTGSAAGSYTLSDTPGFAPGVTINSATVATTGGTVVTPTLTTLTNNTASQISAANVAIAAGASHTYTVTISFNTSAGASNLTCNATPNNGLYNAASITGSTPGSSSNCGPGPGLADMTSAITGLPLIASPGVSVSGTITCTNVGSGAATSATCAATTAVAGATAAVSACTAGSPAVAVTLPVASLAAGGAINCTLTVTMPANPASSDVVATNVLVSGTTGASNETNTANNGSSATITIIDAVNDSATTPFGTAGSLNVLGNDTVGATPAANVGATPNVVITVVTAATNGSTFDISTGNFAVPAGATPGAYTVIYRICATATPAACDTAVATLTVDSGRAINGTVFDDGNGLTDSIINGTGTNAGGLTAYLVGSGGAVISSVAVAANGSYSFPLVADGTYSVAISATAGQTSNPSISLPNNWVTVGEGVTAAGDGTPDGRITAVTLNGASISGVNFAIEQRPVAGGTTLPSQVNPGGTISVPVAASAFTAGSSDADGVIASYTIIAFPTNATSITVGGTGNSGTAKAAARRTTTPAAVGVTYTPTGANGTTAFPAGGIVIPAASIGTVSVDPIDGPVTVAIAFSATDNAGFAAGQPGSANVPFAAATADLAVQKNGPAAVQAGSTIVYTVTLINNGLSAADGATFNDTLPPGLTGVTATCTGSAGTGTSVCASIPLVTTTTNVSGSIQSFPSGGSVVITIRGTAPGTGPVTNTVTITAPASVIDPMPSNNTSTVTTSIGTPPLAADIAVIKTGPAAVLAGGTISYVIDVVNGGPGVANGSTFTDIVPAIITGVTWTCTPSGQAVCPAASGAGNNITQVLAVMPMNGRLRYVVTGTVSASAVAASSIVNTATVTPPSGIADPNPNNNSSTVTTTIATPPLPQANLSMSKIGPTTVSAGGVVTYTLVATNNGPSAANGAVVNDTFPSAISNVTWVCTASIGAACGAASGSGNLNMSVPTFAAGSQVTITVTATAPNSGTFQNSARVVPPSTVTDTDPTDNIGGPVITTVLLAPADLVTTVTVGDQASPAQPVTATVTMSNIGPSPAGNVTVTLSVPTGSTGVFPSGGGIYDPNTSTVTWPSIAFVPANTSPVATYTVTFVPPNTGGTIRSNVTTPDSEVTLVNNPAATSLRIAAAPSPEPIPATPWWLLAMGVALLASRSRLAGKRS